MSALWTRFETYPSVNVEIPILLLPAHLTAVILVAGNAVYSKEKVAPVQMFNCWDDIIREWSNFTPGLWNWNGYGLQVVKWTTIFN